MTGIFPLDSAPVIQVSERLTHVDSMCIPASFQGLALHPYMTGVPIKRLATPCESVHK